MHARRAGKPELFAGAEEVLRGNLAAEVEEFVPEEYRIVATAFVGYVAQGLEARIVEAVNGRVAILLQSTSRLDIVRFSHLVKLLAFALEARGLEVDGPYPSQRAAAPGDLEWYPDVEDESGGILDISWSDLIRTLVEDALNDVHVDVREEAAQALAAWAEACPSCLFPMAQAMADQHIGILQRFQAAKGALLAEAYPLAAALRKAASSSPEAAAALARSMRGQLAIVASSAPRLVAVELSEASRHMDTALRSVVGPSTAVRPN